MNFAAWCKMLIHPVKTIPVHVGDRGYTVLLVSACGNFHGLECTNSRSSSHGNGEEDNRDSADNDSDLDD